MLKFASIRVHSRALCFLCFLLLAFRAAAQTERVTATLTVTNAPTTNGMSLQWSSYTRTFTNDPTANPAVWILTNLSIGGSATNLYNHLLNYPFTLGAGTLQFTRTDTNVIRFTGNIGTPMTMTIVGNWASVTYSTQTVAEPKTFLVRTPMTVEPATNQTNIASALVRGISSTTTNAFETNSIALTNALVLGIPYHAGKTQFVLYPVTFYSIEGTNRGVIYAGKIDGAALTNLASIYGSIGALSNGTVSTITLINSGITNATYIQGILANLTNGYITNVVLHNPKMTNGANYGNAFRSPGPSGVGNDQFGTDAIATNDYAFAAGTFAIVSAEGGTALANNAQAGYYATAAGATAIASGSFSFAGGWGANATKTNATALGPGAFVAYEKATGLGWAAQPSTNNQIRLGTATEYVSVLGRVEANSYTNANLTGTNRVNGDWAWPMQTITSLANGNNIAAPATNVFMRLDAGPTASFSINGIQGGRSGRMLVLANKTGQAMTLENESGVDPTPANRIQTEIPMELLFYDGTAARWLVYRPTARATNAIANTSGSGTNTWLHNPNFVYNVYTNTSATTVILDPSNGVHQVLVAAHNITLLHTNLLAERIYTFHLDVVQDATGTRTFTFGTNAAGQFFKASGPAPAITTNASALSRVTFSSEYTGTNMLVTLSTNFTRL